MENRQVEISQDLSYKQIIAETLGQLKREAEKVRCIQFFQKYWFRQNLILPPWAKEDIAFYKARRPVIAALVKALEGLEIPTGNSHLGWMPTADLTRWVCVVKGQCGSPHIYFTCNLWKRGTPSEQAELDLLHTQCPAELLIYPGDFDFGVAEAPERAAFCHALIWFFADVLVFSELKVEYGRFIGYGVYHDILEARKKGIPILLLRKKQFWLNPHLKIHDKENLICYAKVHALRYQPISELKDLFYIEAI